MATKIKFYGGIAFLICGFAVLVFTVFIPGVVYAMENAQSLNSATETALAVLDHVQVGYVACRYGIKAVVQQLLTALFAVGVIFKGCCMLMQNWPK